MRRADVRDLLHSYDVQEISAFWDRVYERRVAPADPSAFALAVAPLLPAQALVFDIGCGNGRDSHLFARERHEVVCLDASSEGVRRAAQDSGATGVVIDLGRRSEVERALRTAIDRAPDRTPVAFARFLVHAIDDETERQLLLAVAGALPAGAAFHLEFRVPDPGVEYAFGDHFRRPVDPEDFTRRAVSAGFECQTCVVSDEFAVHRDERPLVARVLLRVS